MRSIIAISLVLIFLRSGEAADKLPRVPPGFTIERVTTPALVKHPMMAGFDDRGRLFVACSAGENLRAADLMKNPPNFIKMLEDTNGDGKFDKATVFADKMTLPMGALWYRGALYVASPPHIWKLEDTNDDGVADKRTILVDKFGFSGNAASVHGCFLGPTGRIYWCDGRHGHEFKDKFGKITSKGKAARIFSCKPDGSDIRVHCGGGMDNPVEIDFTETGEMIGSVNILIGRPRGDCLIHWVEGGVYPRYDQQHCLDEFKQTGDPLPPMTNLGHVAVSGMMRYRSNQFGKKFQNNIFTTLFNTHKVIRSELKRSGSTFTTTEHDFLQSDNPDFHPTDVLEDADGSLLVIDTGGWFRIGCPVSKVAKPDIHGAIYRIRKTGSHKVDDPRGLKIRWKKLAAKQLVNLLDDPRPAVREKAIAHFPKSPKPDSLKWTEGIDALIAVTRDRKYRSVISRRNAIWALGQRLHRDLFLTGHSAIADCLSDPDVSIRIAALTALLPSDDNIKFQFDAKIKRALGDRSAAVRRAATRLLGRLKYPEGIRLLPEDRRVAQKDRIDRLCKTIAAPGTDRVLEHRIIYALIRIADRQHTLPYLNDKNPTVRRAALIGLDQMDNGKLTRELVTPLLDTDDPALQKTALAVIAKHPGWAKETLSFVRKWLAEPKRVAPGRLSVLRGFLIAQAADIDVQSLIARSLEAAKNKPDHQSLLLEVMQRASVEKFPKSWAAALSKTIQNGKPSSRLTAVRIIAERKLPMVAQLWPIVNDKSAPIDLRAEAFAAVSAGSKRTNDRLFQLFADEVRRDHPALTKLTIARTLAALPLDEPQAKQLASLLRTSSPLETPVILRAFDKWRSEIVGISLVEALEEAKSLKSLSPHDVRRAVRGFPKTIQARAKPLLAKLGINAAEQERRIDELLKLSVGGDPVRGRAVFHSRKAACASCHKINKQGGEIGPDLTTIGKIRRPRDLVEAIAFPSASLARGFRSYVVVTDRGRIRTGVISRETSTDIILRDAALSEFRIRRDAIEAIRESPVSLMPKGLDKILTAEELRDLFAYLRSRR